MKQAIIILILAVPLFLYGKDYKEQKEIIDSILNEGPAKPAEQKIPAETKDEKTKKDETPAPAKNEIKNDRAKNHWPGVTDTKEAPARTGTAPKKEPAAKNELPRKKETPDAAPDKSAKAQKKDEGKDKTFTTASADQALLKTGVQFYQNGLYAHSLKVFNELLGKFPQSQYRDVSHIWIGKIQINLHSYDKAIAEFSVIKEDSGEYQSAMYYTGECHMLKGDRIQAIEWYQNLYSRYPDRDLAAKALLNTAKLYLDIQKGPQAMEAAVRLIKAYPKNETIDDAWFLLGTIYEKDPVMKDGEAAKKIYKTFLKKANAGEEHFKNSPLKKRVEQELRSLEKNR